MPNPQKEDGYTPIANEILEALGKINLSSYQSRLLFIIWRKTYGFGKSADWISNSQLVACTGLRRQHVSRAKKQLIKRKVVTCIGDKIQFNKDYSQWIELPKSVTVTNRGYGCNQSRLKCNQYRGTQKKITKETNTKEIYIAWNEQGIIIHKSFTAKMKNKVKSALVEYSKKDICEAIKKYATVLHEDQYFWTHKWTLEEFLGRGLTKFVDKSLDDFAGEFKKIPSGPTAPDIITYNPEKT